MGAYSITHRASATACAGTTWAAVEGYQCLAPHRMWMDEMRESVMNEAACARLLAGAEPRPGWRPLLAAAWHRVGAALIGAGVKLRGTNGVRLDTPVATIGGTRPARYFRNHSPQSPGCAHPAAGASWERAWEARAAIQANEQGGRHVPGTE